MESTNVTIINFLLTVEHQSQHTTCFMINLTLKHNTTIIPFSILLQILAPPTKKNRKNRRF